MDYIDINSILKENGKVTIISQNGTQPLNPSEFPEVGELVGLLTNANQYLQVRIEAIESDQKVYRGKVKHESCKRGPSNTDALIENEKIVEFSHSKIHGIFRKWQPFRPTIRITGHDQ